MQSTARPRQASILKWGNSQGVRLTADLLKQAHLSVTDPVRIYCDKGRIVIEAEQPKVNLSQLLAQIPDGQGLDLVDYGASLGRELP